MKRWLGLCLVLAFPASAANTKAVTLRLMIWDGYAPDDMRQEFATIMKKKHGIEVSVQPKTAQEESDFYNGLRDGNIDIVSPAHSWAKSENVRVIDNHLVAPLDLTQIPNAKGLTPFFRNLPEVAQNGKIYGLPIASGPYGLAYDAAQVNPPPTSWNVLWNPENKGKIVLSKDFGELNVYIAALVSGIAPADLFEYDKVMTPAVKAKVKALALQTASTWVGVDKPEDFKGMRFGTSFGDSLYRLQRQGQNWRFAEPQEGTTAWIDTQMLAQRTAQDPVKNLIAHEWINFTLSEKFQRLAIMRSINNDPVIQLDLKACTPQEIHDHHLDQPDYFVRSRIVWRSLDTRTRNGFKDLWLQAIKMQTP